MLHLAIALFVAMPADRWAHVGSTTDFQEYLDKESLKRSGSKVTVWTQRNLSLDRGVVWNELQFDCSSRTATILAYIQDKAGVIAHSSVRPHRPAGPISPNSHEQAIFDMVCN